MARIYHDVEVRRFPDLSQVSPADVEWLLDGVQPDGAKPSPHRLRLQARDG